MKELPSPSELPLSTIQVGGHTPKVVLFDTSAQLVIFGIQFAKKMGMFNSKP
jgi:hypothetical protein